MKQFNEKNRKDIERLVAEINAEENGNIREGMIRAYVNHLPDKERNQGEMMTDRIFYGIDIFYNELKEAEKNPEIWVEKCIEKMGEENGGGQRCDLYRDKIIQFADAAKGVITQDKIEKVLSKVDLLDKKDICVENLSGGEIQKLNIGLGLLSGADLFLLDEPASNMDFINQLKILKMLKELTKKGITSVVVMHDINLALKYGDTFFGITTEHKILHQDGIKFFTSSNLKSIFDMNFEILESNGNIYVQSVD